jgi:N-acetylglucosaminyldiphosphoundecaprenol N-acetyl-beta-D-mannosaminyltransferase
MDDRAMVRKIRALRPDLLYVAFGAPKQEKWIRLNRGGLGASVAMGVGGSLDFIAGTQTRAPGWVQNVGLEWFWRMASQPRRLFQRYVRDLVFLASMLGQWGLLRFSPGGATRRPVPPDPRILAEKGATLVRLDRKGRIPETEARSVVLDLSGRLWLDSAELGALVNLARQCRAQGGRLFLSGRARRVDRLLRLYRLERYLELPGSTEDLLRRLDRLNGPEVAGEIRRSGKRLLIVLPEELEGAVAERIRLDFETGWRRGGIREVVVEGSRLAYLDSAGAWFLHWAHQEVEQDPGRSLWLREFPRRHLERLRRDGFDAFRVDRRRRFRLESDPAHDPRQPAEARST